MRFFNYSYYRFCDFYKKRKDSSAEMTGAILVSVFQCFIIIDSFILVRIIWEYPIPEKFSKFWFLLIYAVILLFNWNAYVKKKKYREYKKIWKDDEKVQRRKKGLNVVLSLIISILIPILYGLIRHNIMGGKGFFG
jgi:energy-coupling factor transporter transmembrane protein EcfT